MSGERSSATLGFIQNDDYNEDEDASDIRQKVHHSSILKKGYSGGGQLGFFDSKLYLYL